MVHALSQLSWGYSFSSRHLSTRCLVPGSIDGRASWPGCWPRPAPWAAGCCCAESTARARRRCWPRCAALYHRSSSIVPRPCTAFRRSLTAFSPPFHDLASPSHRLSSIVLRPSTAPSPRCPLSQVGRALLAESEGELPIMRAISKVPNQIATKEMTHAGAEWTGLLHLFGAGSCAREETHSIRLCSLARTAVFTGAHTHLPVVILLRIFSSVLIFRIDFPGSSRSFLFCCVLLVLHRCPPTAVSH